MSIIWHDGFKLKIDFRTLLIGVFNFIWFLNFSQNILENIVFSGLNKLGLLDCMIL